MAISGSESASLSLASRDRRVRGPPLVERTLSLSLSFSPPALTFDRLEPRLDFVEFAAARLLHKDVVGLQKPLGVVARGRDGVRFLEEWRCKGKGTSRLMKPFNVIGSGINYPSERNARVHRSCCDSTALRTFSRPRRDCVGAGKNLFLDFISTHAEL